MLFNVPIVNLQVELVGKVAVRKFFRNLTAVPLSKCTGSCEICVIGYIQKLYPSVKR